MRRYCVSVVSGETPYVANAGYTVRGTAETEYEAQFDGVRHWTIYTGGRVT
jgi:hypothetical protein